MPELQGRLPVRVALKGLTEADLLQILTDPATSLTNQYVALMKTEQVEPRAAVAPLARHPVYFIRAPQWQLSSVL